MYSLAEENYLKAIYKLSLDETGNISTNSIADVMRTKAASVTDMLRRLSEKKLISYERYQGVKMTEKGRKVAIQTVRKHRLWEVFLFEKLRFGWDEVHDVAEQLEHIQSDLLIEKLDDFLGYPKVDPHGDPIPAKDGSIKEPRLQVLADMKVGSQVVMSGVREHAPVFLQYLDKLSLNLGRKLKVLECIAFDGSMLLRIDRGKDIQVSKEVARNVLVSEVQHGKT